jgi:AI-2 transport protein TqsA
MRWSTKSNSVQLNNSMQNPQTACLVILATVAVGFSLAFLKSVLLPFVIALFIVIGLQPILEFVERKLKLHRLVAFAVTFLAGVALSVGFAFIVWVSISDLSRNSDVYCDRLGEIATRIMELIPDSEDAGAISPNLPTDLPDSSEESTGEFASVARDPSQAVQQFLNFVSASIRPQMLGLANSLSGLLSNGVLILIFVFFLLLGNSQISNPARGVQEPAGLVGEIVEQIRKYLVMKTIISVLTGFAFGIVLWLFGVPLAILFGFLAFLLNYIPNIGPLVSNLLPVPFLVLNSNMSPAAAIVCFVLISAIQFISGNVIETRMMGKSFDVSPVVLLLALMFFGLVWGIVGMFLATPIVSILKIVLQQSPAGRPVAELLAGRWKDPETDVA